jgi:hypothetical protein
MAKKLNATVHVTDDDGDTHMFTPDDEVPAWAAKKIGDHAWAKDDDPRPTSNAGVRLDEDGQPLTGVQQPTEHMEGPAVESEQDAKRDDADRAGRARNRRGGSDQQ